MYDYRSMFDLHGKLALVVGGGSGIGQASAIALAAFGAEVVVGDVNLPGAEETVAQIRAQYPDAKARAISLDMRDEKQLAEKLADVPADVLVSAPSINVRKPLMDITPEEFDRVIGLNLKGTFLLLRAVARGMAERGRGSIMLYSSIRAEVVEPGQGVYAATKAGQRQMARALAAELGQKGVRVNLIAPGVVETPLTAPIKSKPDWYQAYANKNILKRWAQPHEMTGAVVFLASEASSYVTGAVITVDGGWTAADGRFSPPL